MSVIPGRFLTIEGIEGVGKTTQLARLSSALRERGIAHVVTREPGGTPLAERIRDIVLNARDETLPPKAELLLMFAARAVHLQNLVEPNLEAGRWVLCDRFTDATYAYQGGGRGMSGDDIRALETLVAGSPPPRSDRAAGGAGGAGAGAGAAAQRGRRRRSLRKRARRVFRTG